MILGLITIVIVIIGLSDICLMCVFIQLLVRCFIAILVNVIVIFIAFCSYGIVSIV